MGVVLSSLIGLGWAAPADPLTQKAQVQRVMPASIDSEASLEYFIAAAGRLLKGDTSKDLAAMASRLESLKAQKRALQLTILEKERGIAGKEAAGATQADKAARAQIDTLKSQLARVDVTIRDLMAEIERRRAQEQREQDEIKAAEDALRRFSDALANAAHQRTATWGEVSSIGAFAKGLSAAKKREAETRVNAALAQLAEARRLRLFKVPAVGPSPR